MSACSVSATVTEGSAVAATVTEAGVVVATLAESEAVSAIVKEFVTVSILSWAYLVANRDDGTVPTQVGTVTLPVPGRVFAYVLGGITRYRLVPDSYSESNDSFYSVFSSGTLSSHIVSRS